MAREYTKSELDIAMKRILRVGYTVDSDGCEIWNSTQKDCVPQIHLKMGNALKREKVKVRNVLWACANRRSFVKHTHTSCGTTSCIKLEHIVPGLKRRSMDLPNKPRIYTENEVKHLQERIANGVAVDEEDCHIWEGSMARNTSPILSFQRRPLYISRFLWGQTNSYYDYLKKRLVKACGKDRCVNVAHFQLEDRKQEKKEIDYQNWWKLLLQKTLRKNDCLVLTNTNTDGYGETNLGGVSMKAHRASYIVNKNGGNPLPSKDEHGNPLVVRHLCHKEPGCVNPMHLELGTQMLNAYDDKIAAGTLVRGEKHPRCKITEELAQEIKNSLRDIGHSEYVTKRKRAEVFGVSYGTVASIDQNESWSHLPDRHGVVHSNAKYRSTRLKRARAAKTRPWSEQDFVDAGEKIKKNVVETNEGKAGEFPPGMCLIWQLGRNSHDYGLTTFKSRPVRSHVLALESKHKRFRLPGEVVRHLCDNNPCCNSDHLRFGTDADNAHDV